MNNYLSPLFVKVVSVFLLRFGIQRYQFHETAITFLLEALHVSDTPSSAASASALKLVVRYRDAFSVATTGSLCAGTLRASYRRRGAHRRRLREVANNG